MIEISKEDFRHIIDRLLANKKDASDELEKNKENEFYSGLDQGCYEMLNILQSELYVAGIDLKEIGFDIDLQKDI